MTLCLPCTQILNDIDTRRRRLWKKAFIGVVVSTLPMDRNTRPQGPPPPPLYPSPSPPHSRGPGNGRQCGMGPTPLSEVQSLPLVPPAPALPSSPPPPTSAGWCGLGWVFIEGLLGVGAGDLASWPGLRMSV